MRMRQSLAQFEEAFREEAADSVVRREKLRKQSAQRARVRRKERVQKQGKLRFTLLALSIVLLLVFLGAAAILLDLDVHLLTENRHRARCLDSDPDLLPHDREY